MFLVALHEKANFELPAERGPEWYGWSADTAIGGLVVWLLVDIVPHIHIAISWH